METAQLPSRQVCTHQVACGFGMARSFVCFEQRRRSLGKVRLNDVLEERFMTLRKGMKRTDFMLFCEKSKLSFNENVFEKQKLFVRA